MEKFKDCFLPFLRMVRSYDYGKFLIARVVCNFCLLLKWLLCYAPHKLLSVTKVQSIRVLWFLRANYYRLYWLLRGATLNIFWVVRGRLIKVFWLFRANCYKLYWLLRSMPYRLKFFAACAYNKYLSRFYLLRLVREILKRAFFSLRKFRFFLIHTFAAKKYQLISMTDFLNKTHTASYLFSNRGSVKIDGPKFIGNYSFKPIADDFVNLKLPKIEVVELKNVDVIGGTNFILSNEYIIHPDEYIPERDVCPAELNGLAKINLNKNTISITKGRSIKIDCAVSLLGSCTGNYSHWLTETLPKILFADEIETSKTFPILVDDWVHPNFIESLMILNKYQRKIIKVKRWESYKVGNLFDISPSAYVPPELRYFLNDGVLTKPLPDYYTFSKYALTKLRENTFQALNEKHNFEAIYPTKIFLTRSRETTGNSRLLVNIEFIEQLVIEYGYTPVDPAKLKFSDQVKLFSNAEKIVSPLGAALANTIFTLPKCKILALSPYYDNANYYFFSNFMGALGHELYYVLGTQLNQGGHLLHKDFKVKIEDLKSALDFFDKF